MARPPMHVSDEREAVAARWLEGARAQEHYEQDCKGLWVAVFVEAIHDLASPNDLVRASAQSWVRSRDTEPTSFEWVCSLIGGDPTAIRERLTGSGPRRIEKRLRLVRARERRHGVA